MFRRASMAGLSLTVVLREGTGFAQTERMHLAALVMAAGALLGGTFGGRLAGRVQPSTLRWIVVSIGVIVSIIYFVRG